VIDGKFIKNKQVGGTEKVMNQARAFHEASQLAIKGYKVLMSCPCTFTKPAERLIEGLADSFLLYNTPMKCTHEPIGPGWSVRLRSQGEVFFSGGVFFSKENRYFDYYFGLRPVEEVQAEILSKVLYPVNIPIEWNPATLLIHESVHVPTRYERIQASFQYDRVLTNLKSVV
jgi:hypothetical protein